MAEEVTFTMRLDPSDLRALLGAAGASAGPGIGAPTSGGDAGRMVRATVSPGQGGPASPSFMSIFKPLATLEVIKKLLEGLLKNSQVLNTYQAAMGKVFGAAIDLLLTPFIPILNLLMVGVSKLVAWLVTSGALEKLTKIMEGLARDVSAFLSWIGKLWQDIKSLNVGGVAKDIGKGAIGAVSHPGSLVRDLIGWQVAGTLGSMILPGVLGRAVGAMTPLGIGRGILGMGRGVLGMGGAGGGVVAAEGGIPAAAGAAGGGMLAGAGSLVAPAGLGIGVGLAGSYGLGRLGVHGQANTVGSLALGGAAAGAMVGGPLGALVGAGLGAGAGLLGSKLGLFGHKASQGNNPTAAAQAGGYVNSNNTINATVNITMMDKEAGKKIADQLLQEWSRSTGFKLALRGG
jgi:hypothetical protein